MEAEVLIGLYPLQKAAVDQTDPGQAQAGSMAGQTQSWWTEAGRMAAGRVDGWSDPGRVAGWMAAGRLDGRGSLHGCSSAKVSIPRHAVARWNFCSTVCVKKRKKARCPISGPQREEGSKENEQEKGRCEWN